MDQAVSGFPENYDQGRLRSIGAQVAARLAENPRVYKVPVNTVELFAVGDFTSQGECAAMIDMINGIAEPSVVYDLGYESGFRTSYSASLARDETFVRRISDRIDDLLGVDHVLGETIQGQRYLPGQEFKPHHDFFHHGTSYWETEMANGGQRSFTSMVFLNDVQEGGLTDFVDIGMALQPRAGALIIWNNALPDGRVNPKTLHAGRPVIAGEKYIITKWYRARAWLTS